MAQGVPGEMEQHVLDAEGIALENFHMPGIKLRGARRPLRILLGAVETAYDEGLVLSFTLPSGCYATIVLAEIMKVETQ
jgi:tRNA pseudouridine13 synthase